MVAVRLWETAVRLACFFVSLRPKLFQFEDQDYLVLEIQLEYYVIIQLYPTTS